MDISPLQFMKIYKKKLSFDMQPDWSKTFWLNNSRAREKKQPLLEYVAVSGVKMSCKNKVPWY